ncbi:uncharacterized protein LOC128550781 [Mercenaria mercenaria]|uniref:uncharacterized protein LOC128550781 n=1 Tax=Mercenaria mercenaria TaxID=6596 RepID=UPI00234EDEBC|nr:uncharacterized protein LOC128550781 [Mercenaria mercenaria]
MATQNANMCSDPTLRTTACPKYCNNCPLSCYNCTLSSPDVSMCNTVTCGNDQACMMKDVKPLSGGKHSYTLGCEQKTVCDGNRKRFLHSRSVFIDCCLSDLCNNLNQPTTTTATTTMLSTKPSVTATPTSFRNVGQWSEWSSWGPCNFYTTGVTGISTRTRVCNSSHTNVITCGYGSTEIDRKYCSGGGTNACTPAKITDIVVKGSWELNGIVVLQCITSGNPKPSVVWLTHAETNDNTVQIYKGDPSQILIGPIEHRHAGDYVCEASNNCGPLVQKTYSLPTAVLG